MDPSLQAGSLRLGVSFSAMFSEDVRAVSCATYPILCEDGDLPEHVRSQTFAGMQWGLSASVGLGEGFQFAVMLPILLKSFSIEHTLPDGSPYDPTYSLPTGTENVVVGPGDTMVTLRFARRVIGTPVLFSAGVGAALPTGPVSENPFDPMVPAARRQPRQFGNGTVDPRFELGMVVGTEPFGFLASASARVPVYANRYAYLGQRIVSGSFGLVSTVPAPADALRLLLLADLSWVSAAYWDGEHAQNSGGSSVGVRMGLEWAFRPEAAFRAQVLVLPVQNLQGEQFRTPVTLSLGLSGVIDMRKKKSGPGS